MSSPIYIILPRLSYFDQAYDRVVASCMRVPAIYIYAYKEIDPRSQVHVWNKLKPNNMHGHGRHGTLGRANPSMVTIDATCHTLIRCNVTFQKSKHIYKQLKHHNFVFMFTVSMCVSVFSRREHDPNTS
jgi:hypothetical protein